MEWNKKILNKLIRKIKKVFKY